MEKIVDLVWKDFEENFSGFGRTINEAVERRLAEKQKNKTIKDTGERTGYSRKERAAYSLITALDLQDIEKDESVALEIVQKKRVWPKLDAELEQNNGVESGCAFLKHKLQSSYPAKPAIDTAIGRKIYVTAAENIQAAIKDVVSLSELKAATQNTFDDTYFFKLIEKAETGGVLEEKYRIKFDKYNDRYKKLFPATFINVLLACRGYKFSKGTDYLLKAYQYNGVTKDIADKNLESYKKQIAPSIRRQAEAIEKARDIYSIDDMRKYQKNEITFTGGLLSNYLKAKDWKGYKEYVIKVCERFIDEYKKRLGPDKLPFNCQEHEPDWSWAFGKKRRSTNKDKDTLIINSGRPLDFIKRIGGIEITSVSEKYILDKLGFAGVTFGNYVRDDEAKEHVRHFLGAMADLFEVLNFDPKFINKGLHIGFGAYGRGGKALATYYSRIKAINLTKKRGDGTICHEWGHYFDNWLNNNSLVQLLSEKIIEGFFDGSLEKKYFSITSRRRYSSSYVSKVLNEYYASYNVSHKAMFEIMVFIRFNMLRVDEEWQRQDEDYSSKYITDYWHKSFFMRSKYWIAPAELFARAWEVYILQKLEKAGRFNNYLVNGYFDRLVYPQGTEKEILFGLYEKLIKATKKYYKIPDFTPWSDNRKNEYIDLDDKGNTKNGIVVSSSKKKESKSKALVKVKMCMAKAKLKLAKGLQGVNSGYVNWSKSKRAAIAEESGKYPKTK